MNKYATVFVVLGFALLLLGAGAVDAATQPDPTMLPQVKKANEASSGSSEVVPGPYPNPISELDEPQFGDTLTVRTNWRDQQHNSSYTTMMSLDYNDPANPKIHLVLLTHDAEVGQRYVRYMRVINDDTGNAIVDPAVTAGGVQLGSAGAGYNVIDVDPQVDGKAFMIYHNDDGAGWNPQISWETQFIPNFFNSYDIPQYEAQEILWPQLAITRNASGDLVGHAIANGVTDGGIEDWVFYSRLSYDPTLSTFSINNPDASDHMVVTSAANALTTLPFTNEAGDKVAIFSVENRVAYGLEPTSEAEWASGDVGYWLSEDGGDTWDFSNAAFNNITSFIEPDATLLPDTAAANKDTLRGYAEVHGLIDGAGTVHSVFNTHGFDYFGGTASYTARNWYWNDQDELFIQLADGTFWNNATPPAWEQMVSHTQVVKDEATGILWAMWVQYGEPGDTLFDETEQVAYGLDATDDALANGDLYIAASPPGGANGKMWTKGVNVTNTRTMETLLEAGESRSERDPSFATDDSSDYLHLFYTIDFDAGISDITGGTGEGAITENQMVYQRLSKAALIDTFEMRGEWMPNYPLHIDSTGFWYDDGGQYLWDDFGGFYTAWPRDLSSVDDGASLQPDEFELEAAYPNPFNPSTRIAFRLQRAGKVELAVYDVLGREVAKLVDRRMSEGRHQITFFANDLPSGVYFYRLTSGSSTDVRKMVLMK